MSKDDPVTVGMALRRLRLRSGQTVRQVSDALDWSSSKLSRIETSNSAVKDTDLELLLDHYGADDAARQTIASLAESVAQRSREDSEALPDAYREYAQIEARAERILFYGAVVVPGLLQTPEYAGAVIQATPMPEEHFAKKRIETRLLRQAIFARPEPLTLDVVIDEAVLRRPIGGPGIMHRQMIRLLELGERPDTAIRILPFLAGAHPALTGQFAILDLPENEPVRTFVFCDGLTGGVLRNRTDEIERYRTCFAALERLTLDAQQSAEFFATVADGFRGA